MHLSTLRNNFEVTKLLFSYGPATKYIYIVVKAVSCTRALRQGGVVG